MIATTKIVLGILSLLFAFVGGNTIEYVGERNEAITFCVIAVILLGIAIGL